MNRNLNSDLLDQLLGLRELCNDNLKIENFKSYILGFFFFKFLSDKQQVFGNKSIPGKEDVQYINLIDKALLKLIEEESLAKFGYFLAPKELLPVLVKKGQKQTIINDLDKIFKKLGKDINQSSSAHSDVLLFSDVNLDSNKIGISVEERNQFVVRVLECINNINLGLVGINQTELGELFDKLILGLSESTITNRYAIEKITPTKVSEILAKLVTTGRNKLENLYDPACGVGSTLMHVIRELPVKKVYGQEANALNYNLTRMNAMMHGFSMEKSDIHFGNVLAEPKHLNHRFDAIVSFPPIMSKSNIADVKNDDRFNYFNKMPLDRRDNLKFLLHMLYQLDEKGVLASLMPPNILFCGGGDGDIRKELIIKHNVIDAVIGLPAHILPNTGILSCIVVLKKDRKPEDKILFIDASGEDHYVKTKNNKNELRNEDVNNIIDVYRKRETQSFYSKEVSVAEVIESDCSLHVRRYVTSSNNAKEMAGLIAQFGDYKSQKFAELVKSIKTLNKNSILTNSDNVIYFPRQLIVNFKSREEIHDIKTKSNYFEIVLDESIVLSGYINYFFQSQLGKNLLNSIAEGGVIPHISKRSLLHNFIIPVPSLKTQQDVVDSYQLLERVKSSISNIQKELSLSPTTVNSVSSKLEGTLESLNELSEEEQLLSEIRKGESKTLEFKESFSLDVKQYKQNKKYQPKKEGYIEESTLKNIVGFINSEGGTLMIGVDDDGKVTGLKEELRLFHKNKTDNLLLHFKNLAKNQIGADFYPYYDANIKTVNGKNILIIVCKKSLDKPCYLNGDLYVRTSPSTDKLSIQEAIDFVRERFKTM